ncbi:Uncharacterised protein [uncultured archaeon]|nr:Uncharacterised protein [uncultured archaeon]
MKGAVIFAEMLRKGAQCTQEGLNQWPANFWSTRFKRTDIKGPGHLFYDSVRNKTIFQGEAAEVLASAQRPMSLLSTQFFDQPVARVEGTLLKLNRRVVPSMPFKADKIAEQLCVFVDWSGREPELELKGLYNHGRALTFNLKFEDRYHNRYNYVALKGLGMPKKSDRGSSHSRPVHYERGLDQQNALGMERSINALHDWEYSNYFLSSGIRTHVPLALIKFKSILLASGERIDVGDAIKEKVLPATREYDTRQVKFVPYLYLKGFGEMMRVIDLHKEEYEAFAKERGLSVQEYAVSWGREVGRNVALMHNLGLAHGYITDHNLTADGRIVDLDSMSKGTHSSIGEDLYDTLSVLVRDQGLGTNDSKAALLDSYFTNRNHIPEMQRRQFVSWLAHRGIDKKEVNRLVGLARK